MALDASVFNALAQPRKSAIDYRNEYGAADQQYASNALAIQKAQADAADASLARGDQMAYRNALAALPADATPDQAISAAQNTRTPLGMTQAQAMRKAQLDALKTQTDIGHVKAQTVEATSKAGQADAAAAKSQFEVAQQRLTDHLKGLFGIKDVQGANQWLDEAVALGDPAYPPEKVAMVKQKLAENPAMLAEWKPGAMARGMSIVDQYEQQRKQEEDARKMQADLVKAANEKIVLDPVTGKPSVNTPLVNANAQIAAAGAAVTMGTPLPVVLPDGTQGYVQPANRPGAAPTVLRVPSAPGQPGGNVTPPPEKMPATVRTKVVEGQQSISNIDRAISAVQANPDAFGMINAVPGVERMRQGNTKGVDARAQVANIGSLVLHDRSGAAVSASEFPRLAPFIPNSSDKPEAIVIKLQNMKRIAQEELGLYADAYGGGKIMPGAPTASRIGSGGASNAGPAVGAVEGGYRFKGGNPADKNNWEKQ